MLVVGKAFGKRTLVAYLVSIALGAMAFGFVVDTFFMDTFLASMLPHVSDECHGHGAVGIFDYACAVLLASLMIYAKFAHKGCGDHGCCCCEDHDDDECGCHEHEHGHCEPVSVTYRVNGMNCSHCKACVEKAVRLLDGVVFAEADVASKELRVQWHDEDDVNEDALKTAVDEAGFEFGGKI
jgi:copper chaperone CopZ